MPSAPLRGLEDNLVISYSSNVMDDGSGGGGSGDGCPLCGWLGKLCNVEAHRRDDCEHTIVECRNKGCGVMSAQGTMKQHAIDAVSKYVDLLVEEEVAA